MSEYDARKDSFESYNDAVRALRVKLLHERCPAARRIEVIDQCELYLGDCLEIMPTLDRKASVVSDPPYGIARANGMGSKGYDGFGKGAKRDPRRYMGGWDDARPEAEVFREILTFEGSHIIWGGNYFSDLLPVSQKWLWWDKLQTMPSYSDGELAWTSLPGTSTKKFVYNGSGLMGREKDRQHPTQKPVELMSWCLTFLSGGGHRARPIYGQRHHRRGLRQGRPRLHRHRERLRLFRYRLRTNPAGLLPARHVRRSRAACAEARTDDAVAGGR